MARVGTRREAVERLATYRLYDPSFRSIKEAESRLPRDVVRMVQTFTAMSAKERERLSYGQYNMVTKAYAREIRRTEGFLKDQLRGAERLAQLKAVFGKEALTPDQYRQINKLLKHIAVNPDKVPEFWGYEVSD